MNDTYEWMYFNYAKNQLDKIHQDADKAVETLSETLRLSDEGKYKLAEFLDDILFCWGMEVFAIGLQLGLRLALPPDLD